MDAAERMHSALDKLGISDIHVIIAGSAVMQAVLGEAWDGSDMDMWATAAEFPNIQADLVKAGYALSRHVPIDDSSAYVRMSATIYCIHEFLAKDKPLVQVITVKTDSALKAVDTFDITACQVYYVPSQRLIAAASPDAWKALLKRQIVFSESSLKKQAPMEWIRTLKRVCKYLKRGFVIEDAQWARMLTAVSEHGGEPQWVQSGNRHGQAAGVRFVYTPQDGFNFITR